MLDLRIFTPKHPQHNLESTPSRFSCVFAVSVNKSISHPDNTNGGGESHFFTLLFLFLLHFQHVKTLLIFITLSLRILPILCHHIILVSHLRLPCLLFTVLTLSPGPTLVPLWSIYIPANHSFQNIKLFNLLLFRGDIWPSGDSKVLSMACKSPRICNYLPHYSSDSYILYSFLVYIILTSTS